MTCAEKRPDAKSIRIGSLDVVDDEVIHRCLAGLELESELLLDRRENRGRIVRRRWHPAEVQQSGTVANAARSRAGRQCGERLILPLCRNPRRAINW